MRTHTRRRRHNGPGIQHLWGFDNGHLATAVPDAAVEERWQLIVLDGNGGSATRSSGSPEVIGALRPSDVRRILRRIESLR
jgi:hypothetical protein